MPLCPTSDSYREQRGNERGKKVGIAMGHFKLRRLRRENGAIMLRWVSNGAIHPFSNFHGSVKTHCCHPLGSRRWRGLPQALGRSDSFDWIRLDP